MGNNIREDLLAQLSEYLVLHIGLYFPPERWSYLEQGIRAAAQEFGFADLELFVQWLISTTLTQQQVGILASRFTIGETYFFREKKSFEILKEQVLPDLIRSRSGQDQRLRIWSAGCSTGEEPYSIAILLSQIIPDLENWQITILATDINPVSLKQASEGVYREWSFRGNPPTFKNKYFIKKQEGYYEILPSYRKMVDFLHLNLAEDTYPTFLNNTDRMDIIFCRNVLMYFAPGKKKQVINRFHRALTDKGWFLASSTDMTETNSRSFVPVNFPEAIFYRKRSGQEMMSSPTVKWFGPALDIEVVFGKKDAEDVATDALAKLHAKILGKSMEQVELPPAEEIIYEKALELYQQCHYAEAIEKLVVELARENKGSDECKMMVLLAQAYANQGDLANAREWAEKAIQCHKLNPGLHYFLATILHEQGLLDEAIVALKKALYLDPDFVMAHFTLGNLKRHQGKFAEAEKHLENALLLLRNYEEDEVLPESEGMTAGRLQESIAGAGRRGLHERRN